MSTPKILSVDDSRMIHTLINKAFAGHDVQMVFASNGAEGLEVAEREKPDVILLDLTMPVMDGIECLTKLKSTPSLKDIPVIMLTAEAGKENVLKIAKMGVRDYIVKPFVEGAVIDRAQRAMSMQLAIAIGTTLIQREARMGAADIADEQEGLHGAIAAAPGLRGSAPPKK